MKARTFIALVALTVVAPCWGQELDEAVAGKMALAFPFNADAAGIRIGYAEARTEIGVSVNYRDDIAPNVLDAWSLGIYATWTANPSGQLPIGGWFPVGWADFLPESIPVEIYAGLHPQYEFEGHDIIGAVLLGGRIKTGERITIGVELEYDLLSQWFPDTAGIAALQDRWTVWFIPRILF